jgi:hypothetical protein
MDTLTTTVFQELFATPGNRSFVGSDVPEPEIKSGKPAGMPAVKIAHETIISQGYSKISQSEDGEICYSRLKTGGQVEYRSLRFNPGKKRITPESVSDPQVEDPFPSEIVEGFPIGIQP